MVGGRMKRIILILFALSLLPFTSRAEFLDSTSEMMAMVRDNLRMKAATTALTDSVITKYIKQAAYDLSAAAALIARRDTVITTQYLHDYTLDSQIIDVKKVFWNKRDSLAPLKYITVENWDSVLVYGVTLSGHEGEDMIPRAYDWVAGRITLYPVPVRTGDTIIIDAIARPDSVTTGDTLQYVTDFPTIYRPMIVTYATVLTAASLKEWQTMEFYWKIFEFQAQTFNLTVNVGIRPNENK